MSQRKRLTAVLLALAVVAACAPGATEPTSHSSSTLPQSGELVDVTTFDVEWAEDAAVLLDVDQVAAALVSADHAAGRFVFAANYSDLDQLVVGRPTLLAGLGVYHVTGRRDTAEGVEITTELGVLTDVIENGRITFQSDVMAHPDEWQVVELDGFDEFSEVEEEEEAGVGRLMLAAAEIPFEDGKGTFTGTIDGFKITFEIKSRPTGGFDVELGASRGTGRNIANLKMAATVTGLRTETDIQIKAKSLQAFQLRLLNIEGDAELHGGGVETGLVKVPIVLPVKLAVPILVGPIPFYVSIGSGFEFESTLVPTTTALVKGTTTFKGGVGANVNNGTVQHLATFDRADVAWESAEHVGTVKAGIGLLLDFPKVEFGLGHPTVAGVGAEFKFRSEIVSNFELEYGTAGNFPVIVGNCTETKVNFGATVAGTVRMLGITLATDPVALFSKLGDTTRVGSHC